MIDYDRIAEALDEIGAKLDQKGLKAGIGEVWTDSTGEVMVVIVFALRRWQFVVGVGQLTVLEEQGGEVGASRKEFLVWLKARLAETSAEMREMALVWAARKVAP